jgi:hypothetical protein
MEPSASTARRIPSDVEPRASEDDNREAPDNVT